MKTKGHNENSNSEGRNSELELLAPAGGMEQLRAAINFGADAVYVGMNQFSMRAKAKNFTPSELRDGVKFAHENGARVYVTLNTQIHESDLSHLKQCYMDVESSCADAVIVGDVGACKLAYDVIPNVNLHISTQAAVANSESAKVFYEMGAKRVVLAREMTISEIAELRKNVPDDLELEAFVHGAQCMAQSGRCLISSYLCGRRSANAGACTQPCRWGYSLIEEKRPNQMFGVEEAGGQTYILNAKDLCMIDHLQDLESAGVNSIKIEGRNKKAFYVATIVNAYSQVLNGANPSDFHDEIIAVSHRPYSTGFYYGSPEQSTDFDGYTQETLHVADVLDCSKIQGGFELKIRCRNKICEDEELEALIPHSEIRNVKLSNFRWLSSSGEKLLAEVNRPDEIYLAECNFEVPKNSFLRKREKRTTSRSRINEG